MNHGQRLLARIAYPPTYSPARGLLSRIDRPALLPRRSDHFRLTDRFCKPENLYDKPPNRHFKVPHLQSAIPILSQLTDAEERVLEQLHRFCIELDLG